MPVGAALGAGAAFSGVSSIYASKRAGDVNRRSLEAGERSDTRAAELEQQRLTDEREAREADLAEIAAAREAQLAFDRQRYEAGLAWDRERWGGYFDVMRPHWQMGQGVGRSLYDLMGITPGGGGGSPVDFSNLPGGPGPAGGPPTGAPPSGIREGIPDRYRRYFPPPSFEVDPRRSRDVRQPVSTTQPVRGGWRPSRDWRQPMMSMPRPQGLSLRDLMMRAAPYITKGQGSGQGRFVDPNVWKNVRF